MKSVLEMEFGAVTLFIYGTLIKWDFIPIYKLVDKDKYVFC